VDSRKRIVVVGVLLGLGGAVVLGLAWETMPPDALRAVPVAVNPVVVTSTSVAPVSGEVSRQTAAEAADVSVCPRGIGLRSSAVHWVPSSTFSDADRLRLDKVNAALAAAGLAGVPSQGEIEGTDLVAFRALVDDAEACVDEAEGAWLDLAAAVNGRLERDLMARLRSGQVDGLPVATEENSMRRRHPHEAITQVLTGGRSYVLRTSPQQEPRLGVEGERVDRESARRAATYGSLVRPLFRPR
jgi:hypothetical protein